MPHLIPHKSGVHRASCFALYRALLRQKKRLAEREQQTSFKSHLRDAFHKYVKQQSSQIIIVALRQGYELLKGLLEGNPDASNHPWNSFTTPILKKKSAQPTKLSPSDLKSNAPKRFGPRVWPHPDAIPVQSRPFPTVSGRRHVPHLVNGNGFPFLRFKKPQSPYLGRLIRDSLRTKTKRNNRTDEIRALIEFGIDEDVWDEIVEFTCGLSRTMENTSWAQESQNELSSAMELINDTRKRRADMGEKLQKIVEHEQELADAEKAERRREKKRARMLRKSAQKASISQISEGSLTSSPI